MCDVGRGAQLPQRFAAWRSSSELAERQRTAWLGASALQYRNARL